MGFFKINLLIKKCSETKLKIDAHSVYFTFKILDLLSFAQINGTVKRCTFNPLYEKRVRSVIQESLIC